MTWGILPPQSRQDKGYPPHPTRTGQGTPQVDMIRRLQYASCGPARGLSCYQSIKCPLDLKINVEELALPYKIFSVL